MIDTEMEQIYVAIATILQSNSLRMGVAESCTGGWIAKGCTDQAGSSAWFEGGLVTYTNDAKQRLLQIEKETLSQFGEVSSEMAAAMAEGVLQVLPTADVAISVTGIAGPAGGTADKPVGLVWTACALRQRQSKTQQWHFSGTRDQIRRQAVVAVLQGLMDYLDAELR